MRSRRWLGDWPEALSMPVLPRAMLAALGSLRERVASGVSDVLAPAGFLGVVVILLVVAGPAAAADVSIAADGMLEVGGRRTFVIGLYENPKDDFVLGKVARAGFNLVRASEDPAALDRLHAQGLFAWLNTSSRVYLSADRERREGELGEMVRAYGSHPALMVWEVPDEALWNCWYRAIQWRGHFEPADLQDHFKALEDKALAAELEVELKKSRRLYDRGDFAGSERVANGIWQKLGKAPPKPDLNISNAAERAATLCAGIVEGYKVLKGLDPNHPVWMNHAPRNQTAQLAAFNEGADIVGCDIYPAPEYKGGHSDLGDRSLASVGAYTSRMQAAAPGKPVWMVLQGFGWADLQEDPDEEARENGRRPEFDESRFMAYDAIVRGARGVLYWGTHSIEKDSQLWGDLMLLARELADLQPVLSAPDAKFVPEVELAETWDSVDRGVRVLGKDVDGALWWLVVNEFQGPLQYTLHGLSALEGMTYSDAAADRRAVVADGQLRLAIRGYGVQVLKPMPPGK